MGTKIPITEIKTKLQIAVKQAKESNLELECDEEFDTNQLFTTNQVLDLLAATNKESLLVRGGEDSCPMEFSWSPTEGVNFTGLVAPRV